MGRIIVKIFRLLALLYLRQRMRWNADDLDWMDANVRYGQLRIKEIEEKQRRLQAEAWALESPTSLARRSRV